MTTIRWPVLWAVIVIALLFFEGLALGTGHSEYTLSYTVELVRQDPIGRFVFWLTWGFLTAHFGFSPKWLGVSFNWRSVVGILMGLTIAILETVKAAKS